MVTPGVLGIEYAVYSALLYILADYLAIIGSFFRSGVGRCNLPYQYKHHDIRHDAGEKKEEDLALFLFHEYKTNYLGIEEI